MAVASNTCILEPSPKTQTVFEHARVFEPKCYGGGPLKGGIVFYKVYGRGADTETI